MTDANASKGQASLDGHDFRDDILAIQGNPAVSTMLETICLATRLRFAAVARVNERRWVACSTVDHLGLGLAPGDELAVETTLCHEISQSGSEIVINDALCDIAYAGHHTPKMYGFRSYLSLPIHKPDGSFFGTLCALDPLPNKLDDRRVLDMVRLFAKLIGEGLDSGQRLQDAQDQLAQERRLSDVQERFMAILAHDLRNPVTAVRSGLRMLGRMEQEPAAVELIALMDASVQRMAGLVSNLMDHARNRLGEGIVLDRVADGNLPEALELIVSEFRTIAPDRRIDLTLDMTEPVYCDRARIAQLLSNLIGNAIAHGADGRPIKVVAQAKDGAFRLEVANEGAAIPENQLPHLFTAFSRSDGGPRREGLGLGLYIASEIARAHGGQMGVRSVPGQTTFTFAMPHRHG